MDVPSRLIEREPSVERISPVRFVGGAGIVASVTLLLITAVVLAGSAVRVLDLAEKANTAQRTLTEIDALQEALSDASVTARGYLVGGDSGLAAARDHAEKAARQHLANLGAAFDSGDTQAMRKARRLILQRLDLSHRIAAYGPNPPSAWELQRIQMVRTSNALVTQLRIHATAEISTKQRQIAANMRLGMGLALFSAAAVPLFGLIGIQLLRRERDSRRSRELQLELMHVQRLSVMGETSAMLAHEINQPLMAATNYLSVLRHHLDAAAVEKAQAVTDRIAQQIQRASAILQKLRRFIEKRETERSLEAPAVVVEDALTLLGTLDSSILLETRIEPGLPNILVDRVQMQQVLVNLMRNAIEAMLNTARRELLLTAIRNTDGDVEISLADTGPGLPPEIAARLFQPFVTSKSSGMGVGLSISRSIIEQHGGRIWAEPNPDGGSIFRFTLPAMTERNSAAA